MMTHKVTEAQAASQYLRVYLRQIPVKRLYSYESIYLHDSKAEAEKWIFETCINSLE